MLWEAFARKAAFPAPLLEFLPDLMAPHPVEAHRDEVRRGLDPVFRVHRAVAGIERVVRHRGEERHRGVGRQRARLRLLDENPAAVLDGPVTVRPGRSGAKEIFEPAPQNQSALRKEMPPRDAARWGRQVDLEQTAVPEALLAALEPFPARAGPQVKIEFEPPRREPRALPVARDEPPPEAGLVGSVRQTLQQALSAELRDVRREPEAQPERQRALQALPPQPE